jgi:acetyl esterase/lipase
MELDAEVAAGLQSEAVKNFMRSTRLDTMEDILLRRAERARLAETRNAVLDRTGVQTEMRTIPGPPNAPDLTIRIHRPETISAPLPCLFFVHGGGMVVGTSLQDDEFLVALVRALNCAATSIDYRLAPEHPAPAAAWDCYAGLKWITEHAGELGIDANRLAIGGTSGGGGIAACAAIIARDQGLKLCFQYLIYPQLDDRGITPSSRGDWTGWTKVLNTGAWRAVLGDRMGTDAVTPYEAAARIKDLSGMAPTYIDVGAMELFRDESIDYVTRLLQAGIATEFHIYPGCCHGFDLFAPNARVSKMAAANRRAALARAWGLPVQSA